jgi:predicted AlkP superfamily pyrophosphatase or phosphodiesterase
MDMFLHMHCNEPDAIANRLKWYDRQLRRVFEAAREIDPEATMTVISDHGMTPVEHHYDVVGKIESLGLKMPSDYLAVYDSTMARFWFFNDAARKSVHDCLASLACGRILQDEELRKLGVFFPDQRFGELIFLLDPGWLVSKGDFNGKGWMPLGMHGYDPLDPWSDAVFLSSTEPPVPVRTIADIHPVMEIAAGIKNRASRIGSRGGATGGLVTTDVGAKNGRSGS